MSGLDTFKSAISMVISMVKLLRFDSYQNPVTESSGEEEESVWLNPPQGKINSSLSGA